MWDALSLDVQLAICQWKSTHYEMVRDDLRKSVGKILIHPAMRCSEAKLAKVSPFGATRINLRFWSDPKKGIEVTGDFSRVAMRIAIHNCPALLGN
jgi:hypothetical protein